MQKILVLNSGGFDSIVMLHDLKRVQYPEAEIHSIHFEYGNLNAEQQAKVVTKACEELGCIDVKLSIPPLTWTKSKFYRPIEEVKDFSEFYLEYRNLIFLAYAISYAESQGIKDIYFATLITATYNDTNPEFVKNVNNLLKQSGITVHTPYASKEKYELMYLAQTLDLHGDDFFSCDTPDEHGNPCGKCPYCQEINVFLDNFDTHYGMPVHVFLATGKEIRNPDFQKHVKSMDITELRVLLNNDCQLSCEHCFYGFEEMLAPSLTEEEMKKVLNDAVAMGIRQFHFSGKEPLFDDKIFSYTEHLRERYENIDFDVVTNGINVPKYAHKMKEHGFYRVCLSVDDIQVKNGIRNVVDVTEKALRALNEVGIPVEVFLDIHEENWNKIRDIITYLYQNYAVKRFFIRTIKNLGNASDFPALSLEKLNYVYEDLLMVSRELADAYFHMVVGAEYAHRLIAEDREALPIVSKCQTNIDYGVSFVHWNFSMYVQLYCDKYETQLTVTPDGFILGCGSEMSSPRYDLLSAGNVREHSLTSLRSMGLLKSFKLQERLCYKTGEYVLKKCPHAQENIPFLTLR